MVLQCRCCLLSTLQVFERLEEHDRLAELHEEQLIDKPSRTQPADLPGQYYLRSGPLLPCRLYMLLVVRGNIFPLVILLWGYPPNPRLRLDAL
jgi:hypothetical protein